MPVIIDGTNGLTFPDNSRQYNGYFGFKNRIINGDMRIDQRNNGASVTASDTSNAVYLTDRWAYRVLAASKLSFQRSTTAPAGFINSLLVTSLSAYTIGTSEFLNIRQPIEGLNIADFGWGTANAQAVTLSFWVRSSLTGTFGGYITNSTDNRFYAFSYTINSANTWEQKSITIPGDTSGTWLTTNGVGLLLGFCLASGSTYTGTTGVWGTAAVIAPTTQVNLAGTNGATFYITGVQLEEGVVSTNFDVLPYTTQLQLCQRYAINYTSTNSSGAYYRYVNGQCNNTTQFEGVLTLPVPMRITPSLTTSGSAAQYAVYHASTLTGCSAIPSLAGDGNNNQSVTLIGTVASGLTAGRAANLLSNNNQTSYLLFTAEL